MATFRVGQRVRIKWSRGWPELSGQCGRIVSESPDKGLRGTSEWLVAPDCWGSAYAPNRSINGAMWFGPSSDALEPLTDPGHTSVSVEKDMSYDRGTYSSAAWSEESRLRRSEEIAKWVFFAVLGGGLGLLGLLGWLW